MGRMTEYKSFISHRDIVDLLIRGIRVIQENSIMNNNIKRIGKIS